MASKKATRNLLKITFFFKLNKIYSVRRRIACKIVWAYFDVCNTLYSRVIDEKPVEKSSTKIHRIKWLLKGPFHRPIAIRPNCHLKIYRIRNTTFDAELKGELNAILIFFHQRLGMWPENRRIRYINGFVASWTHIILPVFHFTYICY